MLKDIEIHQATLGSNWYALQDCAKLAGITGSSLSRRKNIVTRLFITNKVKKLFLNEASFYSVFHKNKQILAELAHYKTTGLFTENSANKYSDLRTVAFIHAQTVLKKSGKIKLPFIKEMDLTSFNSGIKYTPCIRALIQLYAQSVFYETDGGIESPSCVVQYEIFKVFPLAFDLEELYTIYKNGEVSPELIKAVKNANPNKEKLLEFMQIIGSKALQTQLYNTSIGVLAALNIREPANSCLNSEVKPSGLIGPKALANNWHEYPLMTEFMPKVSGEEILWLGE